MADVTSSDRTPDDFDDSVTSRWWDVAAVGVPLISAGVVLAGGTATTDLLSVAALVGMIGAWGIFRLVHGRSATAGNTALVATVLLSLLAIALSPNAGSVQALVFPLVWTLARDYRSALVANVLYAVGSFVAFSIGLGIVTGEGVGERSVIGAAAFAGFSLIFSIAFGTWITRIARWGSERARLLAELTAAQDDLAAAHRETGERAERERISRELHDTLAQSLTGLVMIAQRARALADSPTPDVAAVRGQLDAIDEIAREALTEARSVVAATAPVGLDGGLAQAILLLAARVTRETGIVVETDVSVTVDRELEVVLLRCAQEALANVRKHAGARAARVSIADDGTRVSLTVSDDGRGIDLQALPDSPGFGLAGMRDRMRLVGGELIVDSPTGGGTRLMVRIPRGSLV